MEAERLLTRRFFADHPIHQVGLGVMADAAIDRLVKEPPASSARRVLPKPTIGGV
jgi:hypothetical protein